MPPTPEARVLQLLRERDASRAIRDDAISAAHAAHAARWTPEAEAALDLAAELAKLDERAPEAQAAPEKPKRLSLLSRDKVNTLLAMLPSDLAHAVKQHTTPELAQLLISAKARRLADHVALIEQEIGGRS